MNSIVKVVMALWLSLIFGSIGMPLAVAQSMQSGDSAPSSSPQIYGFNLSPEELILGGTPLTVALQAHVADDDGDIDSIEAVFSSPSKSQFKRALMNQTDLISGDAKNGSYVTNMDFSQSCEVGVWTLDYLIACDRAGNCRRIDAALAETLGYPTKLQISKISDPDSILESDGSFAGNDIFPDPNELRGWADSENRFSAQKKIIINSIFNRPAICWP